MSKANEANHANDTSEAAMIGHEQAEVEFCNSWTSDRVHHAWLLAGMKGMGKAQFAERIARFLLTRIAPERKMAHPNLENSGIDERLDALTDVRLDAPGDKATGRLFDAGSHGEYIRLERMTVKGRGLARNISIEQVRGLRERLRMTISIGYWRVAVIDAIDDLEKAAANALLKALEEPPAHTVFLLVSHAPGRLLPTIRSRCRVLRFQPLAVDVITAWLHDRHPTADVAQIGAVSAASGGVPGKALALMEGDVAAIEKQLLAIANSGDKDNRLREALARNVSGIAGKERYGILLDIVPSLLNRLARESQIADLEPVLAQWQAVQSMLRTAISDSYAPIMIGFEIGSCFAALAKKNRNQSFPSRS